MTMEDGFTVIVDGIGIPTIHGGGHPFIMAVGPFMVLTDGCGHPTRFGGLHG